jgi:RimJ/RimL family protein N-acetyltransferase
MKMETKRLFLRELTMEDLEGLHKIFSDPESMRHYPKPFTLEETKKWIKWNIENYATYDFGLWGVVLKEGERFVGDCGITMQSINGKMEPEIGYHINKEYTNKGYATEAAKACQDYAFNVLKLKKLYSYMKYTNIASARVAEKNGMKLIMEVEDKKNIITRVYSIACAEAVFT